MANKRDYYEVLGVSKNATDDEIKRAYRKKAKECHPDLHPDDKEAVERFKELNEANEVLSDPDKRARYDQFGFEDPMAGMGGGGIHSAAVLISAWAISLTSCLTAAWAEAPAARARYRGMTCGTNCESPLTRRPRAARRVLRSTGTSFAIPVKAAEPNPAPVR